ncbi:MAG: hypothetical protein IIU53_02610, partial [Rikenellaceae bacterium]|nr:hypothetical protein [Rikenellaceae bacterium]
NKKLRLEFRVSVQFLPKMSLRAFEAIKRSHFLTAKIPLSLFPKFAQCELSGARQLRSPRREFIFFAKQ